MSTPVRVGGFLLGLVALLAAAIWVGQAVGPLGGGSDERAEESGHGGHQADQDTGAGAQPVAEVPGGLMVSQQGYTFALEEGGVGAGQAVPVRFAITGPDGRPVTQFDVAHDKRLHLIAVRRDQTGFQHVHPELADDGTWSTTLDLTPGAWRLFADFKATGADPLTLGADLLVPGAFTPAPPTAPTTTATVDGYTVTLDGDLAPGEDSLLTLTVSKDGQPVTDLEPYLGAYGHLVALREGDLAYLHVHPDGTPDDGTTRPGPEVVFHTAVPSEGRYRLYLDFQHQGVVRTAAFTVAAAEGPVESPSASPSPSETAGHGGHAH